MELRWIIREVYQYILTADKGQVVVSFGIIVVEKSKSRLVLMIPFDKNMIEVCGRRVSTYVNNSFVW